MTNQKDFKYEYQPSCLSHAYFALENVNFLCFCANLDTQVFCLSIKWVRPAPISLCSSFTVRLGMLVAMVVARGLTSYVIF